MSFTNDTQTSTFQKLKNVSWVIMLFFLVTNSLQNCNMSKKLSALSKITKEMQTKVATGSKMDTLIQIEGLRSSKRMLYDNNAIIRTTIRPDDRMNQYDSEIKRLQDK